MIRLAVLSAALLCTAAAPAGAQAPIPITSDTAEYCLGLADQFGGSPGMSAQARALWRSGRALCQGGDVLHGLARVRRSLMMVRGAE